MHRRPIVPVLVTLALLAAPAAARLPAEASVDAVAAVHPSATHLPHPPILIDGDAAFDAPASGVRRGSGTADDPYVIEGWIVPAPFTIGVDVRNTRAHVVIRDLVVAGGTLEGQWQSACRLADPSCLGTAAIRLQNATHVTVERVEAFRVGTAFGVYDSSDVVVRDSIAGLANDTQAESVTFGVRAERTSDLAVEDVRFRRAAFPLYLDQLTNVTIAGVDAVGGVGSSLHATDGARIVGSRFEDSGILLGGVVRDLVVVGSAFVGGHEGISHFDQPDDRLEDATFCGNLFTGVTGALSALYLPPGEDVVVRGNRFLDVESALTMYFTDRGVVERNEVRATGATTYALAVQTTTELRMHNNSIVAGGSGVDVVGPVDGRFNWWGAADGPGGAMGGSGTPVTFTIPGGSVTPWLTSAPDLDDVACDPAADGRLPAPPAPIVVSADLGTLRLTVEARATLLGAPREIVLDRTIVLGSGDVLLP